MAAVKIPTSADIYLEVNGVRVAVVQSYKVTATRSSKAIYAFGQEAPVATIRGQGQYRLELTRIFYDLDGERPEKWSVNDKYIGDFPVDESAGG